MLALHFWPRACTRRGMHTIASIATTVGLTATLALPLGACSPSVRGASAEAARGATPALTQSALDQLEDPATRQRLANVMGTPEIQRAMRELTTGLSQGVVDGLSTEAMNARIDELVMRLTRAIVASMQDAALSNESKARLESFASAVTASVFRAASKEIPASLAPTLHRAMVEELGPAMAEVMRKDVAPGMAALLRSPDVQAALGETTHQMAKQAMLGSNEGLAYLAEKERRDEGGVPLGTIGAFFAARTWLVALLVTAAVLAIPIAWLWRERRAARRYREDAERRNARAAALLGAMEASSEGISSSRILELLREQLLAEATGTRPERPAPPSHPRPRPA